MPPKGTCGKQPPADPTRDWGNTPEPYRVAFKQECGRVWYADAAAADDGTGSNFKKRDRAELAALSSTRVGPDSPFLRLLDPSLRRFEQYAGDPQFWLHRSGRIFLWEPLWFHGHLLPDGITCPECKCCGGVEFQQWNEAGPRQMHTLEGPVLYLLAARCAQQHRIAIRALSVCTI